MIDTPTSECCGWRPGGRAAMRTLGRSALLRHGGRRLRLSRARRTPVHQCCPRQQAPSPAVVEVCHSSLHTSPVRGRARACVARAGVSLPGPCNNAACTLTGALERRRCSSCASAGVCACSWPLVPSVGAPLERGPPPRSWAAAGSPKVAGTSMRLATPPTLPTPRGPPRQRRRCGIPSGATWRRWPRESLRCPSMLSRTTRPRRRGTRRRRRRPGALAFCPPLPVRACCGWRPVGLAAMRTFGRSALLRPMEGVD